MSGALLLEVGVELVMSKNSDFSRARPISTERFRYVSVTAMREHNFQKSPHTLHLYYNGVCIIPFKSTRVALRVI